MDTTYVLGPNGELYHWGIKGMKWGQRRYQNKDGSLTKAGKKRYAQEEAKLKDREKFIKGREKAASRQAKLNSKKAELDAREDALKGKKKPNSNDESTNKPKSMRDMSNDELREYTTRMQLEKQYLDAQKSLASAMPQQVSKGKRFMNSLANDVIVPAAKNAGKEWVEDFMKKKLGLNKKDVDPVKQLENEYKKLEWETKIKDLKKAGTTKEPKDKNWDSELKRLQYEENIRKRKQDEYDRETERIRNEIERSKAERGRMTEEMARAEADATYEDWRKKRQGQGGA